MATGTRAQNPMPLPPQIGKYAGKDGKLSKREKSAYNAALRAYNRAMAEWRKAQVAASTGTRSGDAWTGTVDNLVDEAADVIDGFIPGDDEALSYGLSEAGGSGTGGSWGDYDGDGDTDSQDAMSWAKENPVQAGAIGLGVLGLVGLATGVIKLPG